MCPTDQSKQQGRDGDSTESLSSEGSWTGGSGKETPGLWLHLHLCGRCQVNIYWMMALLMALWNIDIPLFKRDDGNSISNTESKACSLSGS